MIKFEDGEISWFKRLVDKELWLYRSANTGFHALSTLFDRRKWNKRKSTVEEGSKSLAVNLLKMMAIRNSLHRTPCSRQPELYAEFERNFTYTPTADQLVCFADIERDMVNNTRPMDRLICGDVGFGKTEVAMRGTPLFLFLSALNLLYFVSFLLSYLPSCSIGSTSGSSGTNTRPRSATPSRTEDQDAAGQCTASSRWRQRRRAWSKEISQVWRLPGRGGHSCASFAECVL